MSSEEDPTNRSGGSWQERGPGPSLGQSFIVSPEDEGRRLDLLVGAQFKDLSRRKLKFLFDTGRVLINSRRARKGEAATSGDELLVLVEHPPGKALPAPELELRVVLDRADFVIVDKQAGVPCAATLEHPDGTLAGALLARYPEMGRVGFGPAEPGLVHRLDTQTSGLILAAKSASAHAYFASALRGRRLTKRYLAICQEPEWEKLTIQTALGPTPGDATRVRVLPEAGRVPRYTQCHVQSRAGGFALLEIEIGPGYRHQIRAHLASVGLPLLGDATYAGPGTEILSRQALHATHIAGTEPSGMAFAADSPLPDDLRAAWETLCEESRRRF